MALRNMLTIHGAVNTARLLIGASVSIGPYSRTFKASGVSFLLSVREISAGRRLMAGHLRP